MEPLRVNALRSVDLGVADVAANVEFYAKIWELEPVVERNGSVYLRGTGPAHHILGLHPRPHSAILKVTFQAADKETVDALHGRATGLGVAGLGAAAAVGEPGGGYGFEFADPEGRIIRVLAGDEVHDDATEVADRPYKLSHAVFNSGDAETAKVHFERALRLSPLDISAYRTYAGLAFSHLFLGHIDDAVSWASKALHQNPKFTPAHRVLAASLGHAGRLEESRQVVERLQALVPGLTVARFGKETRFRHPEYFELLMDGLRKAGLPEE